MNASKRQKIQVLHTWVISLEIKRKGIHATELHEIIFCKIIPCLIQLSNGQCEIVFNWELQMKSERKCIKVWSMYSPTSFSQYALENVLSLKSIPSLHDMDVTEYSKNGFKCNFWDVRQWVTQPVIGISHG